MRGTQKGTNVLRLLKIIFASRLLHLHFTSSLHLHLHFLTSGMCYTDVVRGKKKKTFFCSEWFNNSVCRYILRFSVLILPHVAAEDVYESQIWAQSTYAPCRQFITVAQFDSADPRIDSRKARKTIIRRKRDRYPTQQYTPHTHSHTLNTFLHGTG